VAAASKKSLSNNAVSLQHSAGLCFAYPTVEDAQRVDRSIRVEVDELDDDRSNVAVAREETELTVEITATDLVALRAAINSWYRYVSVAEQVAGCASSRIA